MALQNNRYIRYIIEWFYCVGAETTLNAKRDMLGYHKHQPRNRYRLPFMRIGSQSRMLQTSQLKLSETISSVKEQWLFVSK